MTCRRTILLLSLLGLPMTLLAQTQIGGGTCSSSSLSGTYALTMTGRQLSASASFTGVFQANGSVTFDGENKVGITLTANTNQAVAAPLSWSGTYSIQADCAGVVNITTGDTATLNLAVYNQGNAFLMAGTDATYSYTGGGNTQPAACLASLLSGVYSFTGTGYTLSGNVVNGFGDASGLLQFDGQGNATANFTLSSVGQTSSTITLTGTYSVSSNCLGSVTLTDSKSDSYGITFSVTASNKVSTLDFDVMLAQASKFMISGAAHAVYGQPTASATVPRSVNRLSEGPPRELLFATAHGGECA